MASTSLSMQIYSARMFTDLVITWTSVAVTAAKAVIQAPLFVSRSGWKEQGQPRPRN